MRYLAWIIILPIAFVIVSFAVSNRGDVVLQLWPLPQGLQLPVYLMVLTPLIVGFLIGGFVAWLSGGRDRRRARARGAKLEDLGRKVVTLQERQAQMDEAARREAETARLKSAERSADEAARLERAGERRALPAAEAS